MHPWNWVMSGQVIHQSVDTKAEAQDKPTELKANDRPKGS